MKRTFWVTLLGAFCLLLSYPVQAQTVTGSLTATVQD